MTKEIILIIAVTLSVVLIVATLGQIGKLPVSKSRKNLLIYVTILIPVLGFFLVRSFKEKA